jgi:hypothetical protein
MTPGGSGASPPDSENADTDQPFLDISTSLLEE